MNLVLLVLTITQAIICIVALKINDNQEKTTQETLDLCTRIVDERRKVVEILLTANLSEEDPKLTVDKIEKELGMPTKTHLAQ